jgi:hypothetical protein
VTWFKVDDQFWHHPKTAQLSLAAVGLWVRAGCWSAQNLTDGFVPDWALPMFMREQVDGLEFELVGGGLWVPVNGGYIFHDWKEYQPTAEQVRALRAVRSDAGKEGGLRSGQARRSKTEANASRVGSSKREAKANPGPVPVPTSKSKALAHRAGERGDFDTFWDAYPRRVGKRQAQAAYVNARKRASAEDILTGLHRLIPSWSDVRFTPHPTTWLNRDGWTDEPTAPSGPIGNLHDLGEQARRLEEGQRFFG